MTQVLLNNISTTFAVAAGTGATTFNVAAGDGVKFALATGGNTIRATAVKRSGYEEIAWEIVDITSRSTDALTVTRAREGTTALEFSVGDLIDVRFTAGVDFARGGGSVATDAIWDAAGDLAVGTGANTAARLAIGTAAQVLQVNSGATALEWGGAKAALAGSASQSFAANALTVAGLADISGASAGQIKFPATQNPSSNANTLDDYEEGTWTPGQGSGLTVVGAFSSAGYYTKIGRTVTVFGYVAGATSVAVTANTIMTSNLPFVSEGQPLGVIANALLTATGACVPSGSSIYSSAIAATSAISFSLTYFA